MLPAAEDRVPEEATQQFIFSTLLYSAGTLTVFCRPTQDVCEAKYTRHQSIVDWVKKKKMIHELSLRFRSSATPTPQPAHGETYARRLLAAGRRRDRCLFVSGRKSKICKI